MNSVSETKLKLSPDDGKYFMPPIHGISEDELIRTREEIERLKNEYGFLEPDRGNLNDPDIQWKNGKPDYTVTNFAYMTGKTKNHKEGSLELIVENMVKTWEMEATHKQFEQWKTVNHEKYSTQANGGETFYGLDSALMGNYNWLFKGCPKDLYDADKETYESSHKHFHTAFPNGFPWEVLEVYSGPPKVCFSWRHWANYTGEYQGNKGNGNIVELTGFAVVTLEDMKVNNIEVYYKPDEFLQVLKGIKDAKELDTNGAARGKPIAGGCPFHKA